MEKLTLFSEELSSQKKQSAKSSRTTTLF